MAALVFLGSAGVGRADDWPQWLGPQRDGVWRETGIVDKFPEGGVPVRWRAKIGMGYAGPAVAGGKVYVTDRMLAEGAKNPANVFSREKVPGTERVLCLSASDGKPLWTHEYNCTYSISYAYGPRTTPLVAGGKVYTLGAEGNLFCLDADKGDVVWSHDLRKEYQTDAPIWGYAAHPLLDGQRLVCMVGGKGSAVVAFDKDSGKEIWRALTTKDIGYCPPMIYEAGGKRQLIVWHSEAAAGLDPETGQVYWSEELKPYAGMAIATPRKEGDSLFLTAAQNTAVMLRLNPDKPTAEVVWKGAGKKDIGIYSVFSTPFFESGYVYGSMGDGRLACIRADTGKRVWETAEPSGGKKIQSADIFLVKNGDRFFLVTEAGDLIIAKLSPEGYKEIGRTHLVDPLTPSWGRKVVWSHPAFADRCVFARNDKEIICASLAAEGK